MKITKERYACVFDKKLYLTSEHHNIHREEWRSMLRWAFGTLRGVHFVVILPGTELMPSIALTRYSKSYEVPPLTQLRIEE